MPDYTCLYIGPSDAVVECNCITAANSAQAMARIEHALQRRADLTAIEIWHGCSAAYPVAHVLGREGGSILCERLLAKNLPPFLREEFHHPWQSAD